MAIVTRFISYALPEDVESDQIQLFSSATETGTFTIAATLNYSYAARATEVDSINTTLWYKLRFRNSDDGTVGSFSDAFPGDGVDSREQFATISSTFDNARFATTSEFYSVTNLNSDLVSESDVIANLKTSKAFIDLQTDDMSPVRYSKDWGTDVTRRKYNAQMELVKQTEILLAAALTYRHLADDRLMSATSGVPISLTALTTPSGLAFRSDIIVSGSVTNSDVSVGQTSISGPDDDLRISVNQWNLDKDLETSRYNDEANLTYATYLDRRQIDLEDYRYNRYIKEHDVFIRMSDGYADQAESLMNTYKPTTVFLSYGEDQSKSKFLNPTTFFTFGITGATESVFVQHQAVLTGLGEEFNTSGFILTAAAMVSNEVDGVTGQPVEPLESRTVLIDSTLTVNSLKYFMDDYVDNNGDTEDGVSAAGSSGGYSLSFDTGSNAVAIQWNNNAAFGDGGAGFDILNTDEITFTYFTAG